MSLKKQVKAGSRPVIANSDCPDLKHSAPVLGDLASGNKVVVYNDPIRYCKRILVDLAEVTQVMEN